VTWTDSGSNPILTFGAGGSFDEKGLYFPIAMYDTTEPDPTRRYKLWYAAVDASGNITVGYAYSTDGVSFTKFGKVIGLGSAGTYDAKFAIPGPVYKKSNTDWYMLYDGVPTTTSTGLEGDQVCLATFSTPESTYTKSGSNPLLSPRTTATQALTANVAIGATSIPVADSSAFNVGEVVSIEQTGPSTEVNRILAIPDGTHITLVRGLKAAYVTASTATIRSQFYGAIQARSIFPDPTDGSLVMATTGWTPFAAIAREVTLYVRSASGNPAGPWTFAYDLGAALGIEDESWDFISAENLSTTSAVLQDFAPTVFTPVLGGQQAVQRAGSW